MKRNFDICMADLGAVVVVVVNAAGKLRFRYTGSPSAKQQSFKPLGITTSGQHLDSGPSQPLYSYPEPGRPIPPLT